MGNTVISHTPSACVDGNKLQVYVTHAYSVNAHAIWSCSGKYQGLCETTVLPKFDIRCSPGMCIHHTHLGMLLYLVESLHSTDTAWHSNTLLGTGFLLQPLQTGDQISKEHFWIPHFLKHFIINTLFKLHSFPEKYNYIVDSQHFTLCRSWV